jgi:hypothetical protein
MKIHARNGSGKRELLLGQPVQPSDGFQCPFSVHILDRRHGHPG